MEIKKYGLFQMTNGQSKCAFGNVSASGSALSLPTYKNKTIQTFQNLLWLCHFFYATGGEIVKEFQQ